MAIEDINMMNYITKLLISNNCEKIQNDIKQRREGDSACD